MTDWTALNRSNWDERAAPHAESPDYAIDRFIADPTFLSDVVRFDLPRLGDVSGARGVATLLAPGGRLFLREGHPVLWALPGPRPDGLLALEFPYFETAEPEIWDEPGTYVDTQHEFTNTVSATWNHGVGEVVTALLDVGLRLTMLVEHDSVPWNALPGQMDRLPDNEFRITDRPNRLPHSYTLQAMKP